MANSCDTVQSIRTGDGVTTQFSFTFTYDKESEVNVSLWDTTIEYYVPLATDQWSLVNATTVEFITPPPALVDPDGNPIANIKIWRQTDVDSLVASFYPGSAIRAQDLNSNFEQLRNAIQEGRCSIPDGVIVLLGDYWNRTVDTIRTTITWESSDDKVATTGAIDEQIDDKISTISQFPEAPIDGLEYARKNAAWSEVTGFPEAPDDGNQYGRQSDSWTVITPSIPEAPSDNRTYGRRNQGWTEVTSGGGGGGLNYRGLVDLTLPAPSAQDGDFFVNNAAGTVNASWTGIGGETVVGAERVAYDGSLWEMLPNPPSSGVETITAGNNISVNNSNPNNPVISVTPNSFLVSVQAGSNVSVDNTNPTSPIINATAEPIAPKTYLPYDISTLDPLP